MAQQAQGPASGPIPQGEGPFAVHTFTAHYDATEDRICLNAVDTAGAKQAIYLTRRIMDQIIPVVAKHLEEKTPKGIPAQIMQSMSQERVRQARQAEPQAAPVQLDVQTPRWLCTTVQLRKQPSGLAVTFHAEDTPKAQIALGDAHLRAMLDIFRNTYAKAGWDMRVFPEWLGAAQVSAGQDGQIRLN